MSESALTTRINAVRRALGDDGTAQRLIRTFTRKGVRFVGEVTQVADRALSDKPSIAVLPFQNLRGDPEQDYFADGMVEEITTAIARSAWLFVIARNSSFALRGKSLDVKQAARELGVRYVLEGSVRRAGNRVRIAGQLIDSATGAHIWAERFDGTVDDIFEFQDLVASGVVGAIEPQLRVVEAVACAVGLQQAMAARDLEMSDDRRIQFRVGINLGDIIVEDGDIFRDGVNIAARREGLAEPGGICISARVHEDVAGKVDAAFEDIGEPELKNIPRPVRAYRMSPAAISKVPLRPAATRASVSSANVVGWVLLAPRAVAAVVLLAVSGIAFGQS